MDKEMQKKVLEQLSLKENKLYCKHNKEKACEKCLNKISNYSRLRGDCSELRGNCSELRGDCSGLRGDCFEIKEILQQAKKEAEQKC